MSANQARTRAHLRPLPRCSCGKPATEAIFNGLNALYGYYCDRHAQAALRVYKEGGTP